MRSLNFARVALESGLVTPEQLQAARTAQEQSPRPIFLAEALVEAGALTHDQLVDLIDRCRGYREDLPGEDPAPRFGEVAIAKGLVSPYQLFLHLQEQRDRDVAGKPHQFLGEVLVDEGRLTTWVREQVLMTLVDLTSEPRDGDPEEAWPASRWGASSSRSASAVLDGTRTKRVRDVMTPAVKTGLDCRLADAIEAARESDATVLHVVHDDMTVGVIDLVDLRDVSPTAPIGRCMKRPGPAVAPGATIQEAAGLLRKHGVPFLLVLDQGQPAGLVTADDLRGAGVPRAQLGQEPPPYEELGWGD